MTRTPKYDVKEGSLPGELLINGKRYRQVLDLQPGMLLRCTSDNSAISYENEVVMVQADRDYAVTVYSKGSDDGEVFDLGDLKEELHYWEEISYEDFLTLVR